MTAVWEALRRIGRFIARVARAVGFTAWGWIIAVTAVLACGYLWRDRGRAADQIAQLEAEVARYDADATRLFEQLERQRRAFDVRVARFNRELAVARIMAEKKEALDALSKEEQELARELLADPARLAELLGSDANH